MTEKFPAFRKYSNNKNFFKIINLNEFIEISVIGKQVLFKKQFKIRLTTQQIIYLQQAKIY